MIKIGVIGSAGYTGGELLRILVNHPEVDLVFVNSNSNAGNKIYEVHQDLVGYTEMEFTKELPFETIDALILCLGHGDARVFLEQNEVPSNVKIVDLSTDFRHKKTADGFVYGLPDLNREQIKNATKIANPGCFATCIQLGLLPLAKAGELKDEVHISAITGSTGAGVKPGATSHFSWRDSNMSVYKSFDHQHLEEIGESLTQLQSDFSEDLNFVPFRGDFTRGIFASIYINSDLSEAEAKEIFEKYYENEPFTHVIDFNPNLKQVVNTNNCIIYVKKYGKKLHIVSMIDNLLKGASGQAVQNLNIMFGLPENTGLRLKPSGF
jgi:N-acetyl-gamma-glutamyl-phosphate reductase